jgi:predicted short-subunit dehydrogenase-like oxidoreductase (DUF2520 family)
VNPRKTNRSKTISFAGAGAVASALAGLLRENGYRIGEIVSRDNAVSRRRAAALARRTGASAATWSTARLDCDILWLAVPDAAIEKLARELANDMTQRRELPPVVLHPSGALSSAALSALARRGVRTASAHPMMTFVAGEPPSLEGAWFALEGDPAAVRAARAMARSLGARSFLVRQENKTLYHAFGAMLSPMLTAELAAAGEVGVKAGIGRRELRRIMEPIVLRTVENLLRRGPDSALSGPLVRGDVATVAAHLKALGRSPESRVYRALTEYAIQKLPGKRKPEMKNLLRGGS